MKKFISMMLAIVLVLAVATPVFATADGGNAAVSNGAAKVGEVVTVTVSLSGLEDANAVAVKFSVPEGLEFVPSQSKWLIEGVVKDVAEGKAALALNAPTSLNGNVLQLAFKIKDSVSSDQVFEVEYAVEVNNYDSTICKKNVSGKIWVNPFNDVDPVKYKSYYNAIMWAAEVGVTSGTDTGVFSPDRDCTRKEIVTFLWRAAGKPEYTNTENPFYDVDPVKYKSYYDAIMWAAEAGVTSGTDTGVFSPDRVCTRKEIVTFLWRAAGKPGYTNTENPFYDVDLVKHKSYYNAIMWAVENGITNGTGKANGIEKDGFSPDRVCTRKEIVTFLYRMIVEQDYEIVAGK